MRSLTEDSPYFGIQRPAFFYVPTSGVMEKIGGYAHGSPRLDVGEQVAREIAKVNGLPLTILAPQRRAVQNRSSFKGENVVTWRSGTVADGGVVLVWAADPAKMSKVEHLPDSILVVVEWIVDQMAPWAESKGATVL